MEAKVFRMTEALQNKDAEHAKNMAEVLESAVSNYKTLEEEHFRTLNTMKEAEELAKSKASKRASAEEEMAQMKQKMRELEAKCVRSISKAREDGKQEVMGKVKAQFQMVYNSGFRHRWKSALKKTIAPAESELYLWAHIPLPYPNAGLKDTDDEVDNKDEDEDEKEDGEDRTSNQGFGSRTKRRSNWCARDESNFLDLLILFA